MSTAWERNIVVVFVLTFCRSEYLFKKWTLRFYVCTIHNFVITILIIAGLAILKAQSFNKAKLLSQVLKKNPVLQLCMKKKVSVMNQERLLKVPINPKITFGLNKSLYNSERNGTKIFVFG